MSNPTPASGDAAPKKKSKKKLLIIVVAAVVLLGGAGAYFMLGSSGSTAKPKPVPGKVIALDAITVNLAGGHYLKIHLALQATATAGEEVDGSQALDLTVAQFSDLTMAELASAEGRKKAKEKLLTAVEKAYEEKIMDIYIIEFVMQ
jgi:flagellar FliL protein